MKIRSIATGIFAIFLFMGLNVSQKTTEGGMTTDIGLVPVVIAKDEAGKGKADICHKGHTINVSTSAVSAHLAHGDQLGACQPAPVCVADDDTADKAKKADKTAKDAKDSKDKADKDKADIDADKDSSAKDKKDAKDKADKADKDAKDTKDKADKAPCTTKDGKKGHWSKGPGKPTPEAFRELHGN